MSFISSTVSSPATNPTLPVRVSSSKLAGLMAIMLGGAFIFLIGFSHMGVVHNAAHDTRHSFAFPCH